MAQDHLDVILLANLALSVVLPALVALVTNRCADKAIKSLCLLLLSAVAGAVTQLVADGGIWHWKPFCLSIASTFIASVAVHYGLLKPTRVTGTDGVVATAVPQGIGGAYRPRHTRAS